MHILCGWAIALLKQFCVVSVDEKKGKNILEWMDRHLFDHQITTSSRALRDFVKERGKETCFVIPNTKLSYFECYLEEIKEPVLMVYHFDHEERESFFSQDDIDILSVVLMLYPRKRNELLLEFLGEITMLIIEEADTILLFENGEEEKLFRLLGQRVKQYILDHV